MAFQRLSGDRERADRIQAALVAHPEIREIALETNDGLFDEAAERFTAALAPGVTMRLEVAHAVGIIAAGAVEATGGDDRFRAAREVAIAGYIWRMCELDPELARLRAGEMPDGVGETPSAAECATTLVAEAVTQAVAAGDPVHFQSPGGPAFGRRFLGRGTALSRATVPAAGRLDAAEHDALFTAGVCLRDVEPALADEPPSERVHVGITPAAPARSS